MKKIELTKAEIEVLEAFLNTNPCECGCYLSEMQLSKKDCNECKITIERNSILNKLNLV